LRVLLISVGDDVPRDPRGAVAQRLASYAERVEELVQVTYSARSQAHRAARVSPRFRVYPTRSRSRASFLPDGLSIGGSVLRAQRFDLIETQDPAAAGLVGLALGRAFDLPVVVGAHSQLFDGGALSRESARAWVEERIARAVARRADGVRAVSAAVARSARALGVAPERVGVAPVPVDRGLFSRGAAETPARRGWSDGAPGRPCTGPLRLLFSGRLVASKDLPTLLSAIALASARGTAVRLDVAGAGPALGPSQRLAARLGLGEAVVFHGRVETDRLSSLYWDCDALVLPTIHEGYGRVLVEAALHGAPSVASRVGGVTDVVVDGQTGRLIEPRSVEALAEAIAAMAADPERRRAMGQAAWRRAVACFQPDRQADAIVAFWQQIRALGRR
jgi:glycosyltransferase involved in cell wall biosynthesis